MIPKPYYQDEHVTLYCGDCREILPELGKFDLLIADPPYGIEFEGSSASTRIWQGVAGDSTTDCAKFAIQGTKCCKERVVFGANTFPELLPHRGRWICWDKRLTEAADKMLGSAFELAWIDRASGFDRMFRKLHGGVVNADGGRRVHPMQKPVGLYRDIINTMFEDAQTILDPFAGSCTTGVAAKLEGRHATLIEISERYCEIGVERLRQGVLF